MVYCAAERAAAFGETIARFRRGVGLGKGLRTIDDEKPVEAEPEGEVLSEEWSFWRRLRSTRLDEGLVFADFAFAVAF